MTDLRTAGTVLPPPSPAPAAPARPARPARQQRSSATIGRVERTIAFVLPLTGALAAAGILVLGHHSIYNDAQSRLANGYYVLYSRDPHLAAVGFVWNPLSSFADLPLLLFKGLWHPLATEAFAANIMSALFMAGASYHLYRFLEELGLGRLTRWGLWLCFAGNALVFFYAANGMSEALFLFTLVATARYLAQWLDKPQPRTLVAVAIALAAAYLARNEAAVAAVAVGLLVVAASYWRAAGSAKQRRVVALTEGVLVVLPVALAFVGWAVVSWLIVGHPFEQFSSIYGNSNQVKLSAVAAAHSTRGARLLFAIKGSQSIAPLLLLALLAAGLRAWRTRDPRVLAVVAVVGSVLAFEIVAYTLGQLFPFFRYYIYAAPVMVMTCGCLAAPAPFQRRRSLILAGRRRRLHVPGTVLLSGLGLLAIALDAPGLLTTAHALGTSGTSGQAAIAATDRAQFDFILWPNSTESQANPSRHQFASIQAEATKLDSMNLPHGALMVDNFTACIPPLIVASLHPQQFSIPNDEDFKKRLGVPYQFGVRYFLVPNPSGYGSIDALNRQYPSLYENGQGLATLVTEVHIDGCPDLRLYRLIPQQS